MRILCLVLIRLYQRHLSPRKGYSCAYRHYTGRASCSALGYRVIRRHGTIAGLQLLRTRFLRCGQLYRSHRPLTTPLHQRGECDCSPVDSCDHGCDGGDAHGGRCVVELCDGAGCDWPWDRKRSTGGDTVRFSDELKDRAGLRQETRCAAH